MPRQWYILYRISGNFHVSLIFAVFATSLLAEIPPKIDTGKNKPYYVSPFRFHQIAKIGLREKITHLHIIIFAKFSQRKNSQYTVLMSLPASPTKKNDLYMANNSEIGLMIKLKVISVFFEGLLLSIIKWHRCFLFTGVSSSCQSKVSRANAG